MSVIGHALLFTPILDLLAYIPLVGKFLSAVLGFAAILFALLWASVVHCVIMGVSWFVYRPVYAIIAISVLVISIIIMFAVGETEQGNKIAVQ